jgi:hypothetical protein
MQAIGGFPAATGNQPFGDNLMGAFNAFLQGRQTAINANQETELKKAQVQQQQLAADQANQLQAKTQLQQYASGLTDTQKSDPDVIKQYTQLYGKAGMIGSPLQTGPDGRQVLNTDSVLKKPWAQATDQEQQYIAGLQKGPQRDAYLDAHYYGVDPAVRNAPPVRTPAEQISDITQASKAIQLLGSGMGNPAQTAMTLQMLRNTFPDPEAMDQVITQLTDPTNAQIYLGPIAAAHAQQYTDLGLDQKAVANYKNMLVQEMPKKWAGELRVNQENADTKSRAADQTYAVKLQALATAASNAQSHATEAAAATSRAESAALDAQNHADANSIAKLRLAAGTLNQYVISMGNAYKTASAQANALIANGKEIGDVNDPTTPGGMMKAAHDALLHAEAVQANVQHQLVHGPANNVSKSSGKATQPANNPALPQYKPGQAVPGTNGFKFTGKTTTVNGKTVQIVTDAQGNQKGWTP